MAKNSNSTCHYCRISKNRRRSKVRYLNCTTCRNSYCSSCLSTHLQLDFDETKQNASWRCSCCLQTCCCSFSHCPNEADNHRHCFTYRRTVKRHKSKKPKWIKSKKTNANESDENKICVKQDNSAEDEEVLYQSPELDNFSPSLAEKSEDLSSTGSPPQYHWTTSPQQHNYISSVPYIPMVPCSNKRPLNAVKFNLEHRAAKKYKGMLPTYPPSHHFSLDVASSYPVYRQEILSEEVNVNPYITENHNYYCENNVYDIYTPFFNFQGEDW